MFVATKMILVAALPMIEFMAERDSDKTAAYSRNLLHRRKSKELLADVDSQQRAPQLLHQWYHI